MSRWNLAWLLTLPTLLACGLMLRFASAGLPKDKDYERMKLIADVLAEVEQNYVEDLDDARKQKLVEDMLNGGLRRLDDHSMYFNEDMLKEFQKDSQGEFVGVGILMAVEGTQKFLTIKSPLPNGPAYDAGLQSGDMIVKIEDRTTENLKTDDARRLIQGKEGTPVKLTVRRRGAAGPEELTLVRAKIEQPVVSGAARWPDDPTKWDFVLDAKDKIALIRISQFSGKTTKELRAALEQCEAAGCRAIVLDLRGNPGGLLNEAIDVSDLFLAKGGIVTTKVRGSERAWAAKDDGKPFEKPNERPMAVLIDGGSASASEIVAAALQENGRAVVVGEKSYGKGSVQKVFELPPDRGAVKVTTEVWVTPNGKNFRRSPTAREATECVEPDAGLAVPLTDEQRKNHFLAAEQAVILPGKPGVAPKVPPAPTKPELTLPAGYKDPVVEKALEHLRKKLTGSGRRDAGPAGWVAS